MKLCLVSQEYPPETALGGIGSQTWNKARTLALLHTDAYARYGAQGNIVAKTRLTPKESEFKPLTPGTSDEDVWKFVCEGKAPPPKK